MKKSFIYGLSMVILLSLTACGTAQANQPDPTQTPAQEESTENYITQAPQLGPEEKGDIGVIGGGDVASTREPTQEELVKEFEGAYEVGKECIELGIDEEGAIGAELSDLNYRFDNRSDLKKPDNLEAQYRAWRAEAHPAPAQAEIQLFTDCNETVYATGEVNIRSSYSTDSTKLGSLTAGQSITRIGTAIPGTEAEGWSKVQLSDGTIAYMVSSYLSTSKPQQQTRPSGGTQQQQTGGQQQAPGGNNTTPGGTTQIPGYDPNFQVTGGNPIVIHPDDPWEGQAEIDFGD